jgi:hypothetical protein
MTSASRLDVSISISLFLSSRGLRRWGRFAALTEAFPSYCSQTIWPGELAIAGFAAERESGHNGRGPCWHDCSIFTGTVFDGCEALNRFQARMLS